MPAQFLLIHNASEDEVLIPTKDISKVLFDHTTSSIDIYTYGGCHYWEDGFLGGKARLIRFKEIMYILNGDRESQKVLDHDAIYEAWKKSDEYEALKADVNKTNQ